MTAAALDTNVLLLLVVGVATGKTMGKRLKAYTDEDLATLTKWLSDFDQIVTTPNVWSEVSNISSWGITGEARRNVACTVAGLVRNSVEIIRPSKEIVDDEAFERLGLTDCVWLSVLDDNMVLLTDEVPLYNFALSRGKNARNFSHLRSFA
jgi:hypothetical protein